MKIVKMDEIYELVTPILKKYDFDKVYLFGSYSRDEATENSDIDLAFETQKSQSYLDVFKIESEIKEATGKDVDLVPLSQLRDTKTPIGKYMLQNGFERDKRLIYEKL